MTTYWLPVAELRGLFGDERTDAVYAPAVTQGLAWMDRAGESTVEALSQPRASQSSKGFLMPATEALGSYSTTGVTPTAVESPPMVLVGARACALRARAYLDKVLLDGPFVDERYRQRREQTTVVSCDCVACAESCFCTSVGGKPYATDGYDVNLTPLEDGCVADVATDRGAAFLGAERVGKLTEATEAQLAQRDRVREEMTAEVTKQNAVIGLSASDSETPTLPNDDDDAWQAFAADCVECGACTHICPTCHCFYLYDQAVGADEFERVRTWDSCLFSTYHRMAGGVNMKLTPRPRLLSRLANRILHKFAYSPQQYELLGCVGCGRCVDACIGAIDIREVVKELGQ